MATSFPAGHPALLHRRLAKDLLRQCRAQQPDALRRYQAIWQDPKPPSLQRCQHVIAKEAGAHDWDDLLLRAHTQASAPAFSPQLLMNWDLAAKTMMNQMATFPLSSSPLPITIGMGRWIGGTCTADVIHRMFPNVRKDPLWIPLLASCFEFAARGSQHPTQQLVPFPMSLAEVPGQIAHAVCALMQRDQRWPEHFMAEMTPWLDADARHPITVDHGSRHRSLLVSGHPGSGKTVWLNRLIASMHGKVAILGWDVVGDLTGGPRVNAERWNEHLAHPQGTVIVDAHASSLPKLVTPDAPCLLIVNGWRPGDEEQALNWVRTARHHGNLTIVIAGQYGPEHRLHEVVTDHLAFRRMSTSAWSDLPVHPSHLATLSIGQGYLRTAEGALFLVSPKI